jgi:Co/Zn/Cd efflux system component
VIATVIFGVIQAILSPFFESVTERNAQMLTGAAGLFSAFVALIATETITDSLNVQGATTWFLAALIIWLGSMFAGFLLKVTVAKRFIQEVRD